MKITCITIFVKEENIINFINATIENHNQSIKEPGNLRFDFLQCSNDPSRFFLYEVYDSEESAAAHKNTSHYAKWRDTVAGWMAKPREGIQHSVICPEDIRRWK